MKFAVILAISFAVVAYATDVPILRNDQHISPDGHFSFSYETGDGISHSATGDADSVQGDYKYTAPDGTPIGVNYVADENGYLPAGAHIPGIDAIVKGLAYIRAHPPQGLEQGAYKP